MLRPGERHGARPGHGISAWHLRDSRILGNQISDSRDGIYLSFTDRMLVAGNTVSRCRYGLHSMYSLNAKFENNDATANLLGAALMMSDRLELRGNRIRQHRDGAAAYGVLLKDIGDLVAEDNQIISNRIGIYAEAVPSNPARQAVFQRNLIAGNEVGLALQSTAALTLTGNRIAENLADVRPLGRQLSPAMRWSHDGRGNSWGQYRGYDRDGDGIGDMPHRVEDAMDALVRRNPLIQAFLYTPAHLALEAAARMFPLYRQAPILIDDRPLMRSRRRAMIEIAISRRATAAAGAGGRLADACTRRSHTALRRQRRRQVDAAAMPPRHHELRRIDSRDGKRPARRRTGGPLVDRLHAADRRSALDLTVRETMDFYAEIRGASRDRGVQLLGEAGLESIPRHRVGELSGGMRQRLGFALALLDRSADPRPRRAERQPRRREPALACRAAARRGRRRAHRARVDPRRPGTARGRRCGVTLETDESRRSTGCGAVPDWLHRTRPRPRHLFARGAPRPRVSRGGRPPAGSLRRRARAGRLRPIVRKELRDAIR